MISIHGWSLTLLRTAWVLGQQYIVNQLANISDLTGMRDHSIHFVSALSYPNKINCMIISTNFVVDSGDLLVTKDLTAQ